MTRLPPKEYKNLVDQMFQVIVDDYEFTFYSDYRYSVLDYNTGVTGGNHWKVDQGDIKLLASNPARAATFNQAAIIKQVREKYDAYLAERVLE